MRAAGPEARITATVKNTGPNPAYPVALSVSPESFAALWSDNYFWLAPGESKIVTGMVRLDMRGIDPISKTNLVEARNLSLEVSAWNAARTVLPAPAATSASDTRRRVGSSLLSAECY